MTASFFSRLFSNAGWHYKFTLSLVIVVLLCLWSWQNSPASMPVDCLANPTTCDGRLLTANDIAGRVKDVEPWGFWLENDGVYVKVVGQASGLHVNDIVFLEATFHREGYLELRQICVSRYRYVRIGVSLLTVGGVVWLFFRSYRFDLRGHMFVRRSGDRMKEIE